MELAFYYGQWQFIPQFWEITEKALSPTVLTLAFLSTRRDDFAKRRDRDGL